MARAPAVSAEAASTIPSAVRQQGAVQARQPRRAVGVVERHAGAYLLDRGGVVVVVGVDERHAERLGEQPADGRLPRARDPHDHDDQWHDRWHDHWHDRHGGQCRTRAMMPTMVDSSDHSPHIGPLSHLRVLDMSRLHPGAFVTGLLADFGADVVRVEQPGSFDPLRYDDAMNVTYNRGKRSFTLDLKHERAPEVLRRLVRGVDVVVESARPGSLEARGIGYEQLAAERPGAGVVLDHGVRARQPLRRPPRPRRLVPRLLGDAGADGGRHRAVGARLHPRGARRRHLMATVGILVALQQRDRTGHGSMVDASVVDAASWMLGEHVSRVAAGGTVGWGKHAGRRAYRCADGRLITLGAAEPRTWGTLCELLDRQDLTPRSMDADQQALTDELAAIFATRPASEWVAELGPTAACLGPVNRPEDLLTDPHVLARRGHRAPRRRLRTGGVPEPPALRDRPGRGVARATRPRRHRASRARPPTTCSPPPATTPTRSPRCARPARSERDATRRRVPRRHGGGHDVAVEIDLSGHRALVTGGGQGVGRGVSLMLGAAGAEVLVNDLVAERTQRRSRGDRRRRRSRAVPRRST